LKFKPQRTLSGIRERVKQTVPKSLRYERLSWAFHPLRRFIAYQCEAAGMPLLLVDPRNTSAPVRSADIAPEQTVAARVNSFVFNVASRPAQILLGRPTFSERPWKHGPNL
jgi:hypothetical protein